MTEAALFETEELKTCCVCGFEQSTLFDPQADLRRCPHCTYVFASPRPTLRELEKYYSTPTKYDEWLGSETERDALWKRRLQKMERTKAPGTLLDVGAGIGQLLSLARGRYTQVLGTELSDSGIQLARTKYGVEILKGDLETISFNQTFDNISLFHILEHVHHPRRLLDKCRALLNPGGRLVIAVPNDLLSWELKIRTALKRLKGKLPASTGRSGIPKIALDGSVEEIHLSQFTPTSLRQLLKECGYRLVAESLDPYFAKKGFKFWAFNLYFLAHSALHRLLGINRYNTIWMVAEPEKPNRREIVS